MTSTPFTLSPLEAARVSSLAYEGKRLIVFLANDSGQGYDESDLFSSWRGIELAAANGYAAYTAVIPVGGWDAVDLRFEIGANAGADEVFPAQFTATGSGFTYNRVIAGIQEPTWTDPTYPMGIWIEPSDVFVPAGQTVTYNVTVGIKPIT